MAAANLIPVEKVAPGDRHVSELAIVPIRNHWEAVHTPSRYMEGIFMSELLREADAAQVLNLTVKCLRKMRSERRGPPWIKLGGSAAVRYRRADLEQYIAAGRQRTDHKNAGAAHAPAA